MQDLINNKKIWDKCKRPPKHALKQIQAGTLKGMTDINPQWRYEVMTEMFGPCGTGWGYTVDKLWIQETGQEVLCFAQITAWYKDGETIHNIPGCGGSKLVEWFNDKKYARNNDEGFKMAITDALSTALKMLGVGADIYAGRWDGSKYKDDPPPPAKKEKGNLSETLKTLEECTSKQSIELLSKECGKVEWTPKETRALASAFKEKRNATAN